MKIIKMITDLYESTKTITKEEWKENATAFFQHTILRNPTEEQVEEKRIADEEERWQETLAALLEGVDEKDIPAYKTILTNQYNHALQQAKWNKGKSSQVNVPIIPIVRRMLPLLTIKELIGFQPMNGPVGLNYKLRYAYEERIEEESEDDQLSDIFKGAGRRMTLNIESSAVEAGTKRMQAGWMVEAMEDLNAMHGLNIEAEMIQALAHECATEHNCEWLHNISMLAAEETTYDDIDEDNLPSLIFRACSRIAQLTRRGAGNWVVVSPMMLSRIQTIASKPGALKNLFTPAGKTKNMEAGLSFAGTLNDSIRVYCGMYQPEDEILVGYKGGSGETDTGLIYSPYIALMSSGVVINPVTFEPVVGFMTRYGRNSDEKSKDYYQKIKVTFKDEK